MEEKEIRLMASVLPNTILIEVILDILIRERDPYSALFDRFVEWDKSNLDISSIEEWIDEK